jgi:hypothetical protein
MKKRGLELLGDDLALEICSYLLGSELRALTRVWRLLATSRSILFDELWRGLCYKRWKVSDRILRIVDASCWREVYRALDVRNLIPDGKYSGKSVINFGRGCSPSKASIWFSLGHGTNAILRPRIHGSTSWHAVEGRLCIQNLFNEVIQLPLTSQLTCIKAFASEELENDLLLTADYRPIAINGSLVFPTNNVDDNKTELILNPLSYAVISFTIFSPVSVLSEPDFLSMIESFEVRVNCFNPRNRIFDDKTALDIKILSENSIWNHYNMLPSGIVLLKDRPLSLF